MAVAGVFVVVVESAEERVESLGATRDGARQVTTGGLSCPERQVSQLG